MLFCGTKFGTSTFNWGTLDRLGVEEGSEESKGVVGKAEVTKVGVVVENTIVDIGVAARGGNVGSGLKAGIADVKTKVGVEEEDRTVDMGVGEGGCDACVWANWELPEELFLLTAILLGLGGEGASATTASETSAGVVSGIVGTISGLGRLF